MGLFGSTPLCYRTTQSGSRCVINWLSIVVQQGTHNQTARYCVIVWLGPPYDRMTQSESRLAPCYHLAWTSCTAGLHTQSPARYHVITCIAITAQSLPWDTVCICGIQGAGRLVSAFQVWHALLLPLCDLFCHLVGPNSAELWAKHHQ